MATRRGILGFGLAGAAGLVAGGSPLQALAQSLEPRRVALQNLHTGEALSTVYWEGGRYVPDAVAALNRVLRDHRTGDVHMIDPGLYDILDALSARVEARGTFQIISGYRSPRTNAALHARSSGVATRSLHMDGKAMDVRLDGVQLGHLHKAALDLKRGGVGFYPVSNFVHVDVGRVRAWRGA